MDKYFVTQFKRLWRLLPLVVCVMGLLFGGVYLAYQGIVSQWMQSDTLRKVTIATVGTNTDPILQMGLNAVKNIDSSSMAVSFVDMEEQQAKEELQSGTIAAYIVFPEAFLDGAFQGTIEPLRFVSAAGSENIVSLVKDELTSALATLLLSSERGAFAMGDALADLGYDGSFQYEHINEMAKLYVEQGLKRDDVYAVEELGISNGLKFEEYMLCGLSVVFLLLMTLPFVAVFVREDPTMERLLKSRRVGAVAQTVCELGAYTLFLLVLTALLLLLIAPITFGSLMHLLPVTFCIAAISYLIYNLSKDLISGVLLQMVVAVALCFVSGCFYPVYFFPVSVQKLAEYLPAAIARNHISCLITGEDGMHSAAALLAIGTVCGMICVLIRHLRVRGKKEAKH